VETGQGNISPEVGITSTPVIDPDTGTIYVEARTKEISGSTTNYVHRLHALDIATGLERTNFNSPVIINSTNYPGTGTIGYPDNDGAGHVLWNPLREHSRPGLLLLNGVVYFAYASPGDHSPYHGWVFGYDAHTLPQKGVFNTTPNGGLGGIWQSGNGLVADPDGFIYIEAGNGTFDPTNSNFGDSILKLSTTNGLALADYFTPYDEAYLDAQDLDLGSGGSVVLPDSVGSLTHPHLVLGASKTGTIYLLDRDNLGQFNATNNSQIVQVISNTVGGMWNTPAYYNGTLYYVGVNDTIKAFSISGGAINPTPIARGTNMFGYPALPPASRQMERTTPLCGQFRRTTRTVGRPFCVPTMPPTSRRNFTTAPRSHRGTIPAVGSISACRQWPTGRFIWARPAHLPSSEMPRSCHPPHFRPLPGFSPTQQR
jgi:hypothetical protein